MRFESLGDLINVGLGLVVFGFETGGFFFPFAK